MDDGTRPGDKLNPHDPIEATWGYWRITGLTIMRALQQAFDGTKPAEVYMSLLDTTPVHYVPEDDQ